MGSQESLQPLHFLFNLLVMFLLFPRKTVQTSSAFTNTTHCLFLTQTHKPCKKWPHSVWIKVSRWGCSKQSIQVLVVAAKDLKVYFQFARSLKGNFIFCYLNCSICLERMEIPLKFAHPLQKPPSPQQIHFSSNKWNSFKSLRKCCFHSPCLACLWLVEKSGAVWLW